MVFVNCCFSTDFALIYYRNLLLWAKVHRQLECLDWKVIICLNEKTFGCMVVRHGPEVPKFVFMAVCFETHCHAKSMAQLITISVGSPSTYILLKFKKLNLSPSQQDPNWARLLKMPPR